MSSPLPRVVIAGTQSGVGKTSVSLALVAALRRRGLKVQTFKVGPDFLDPSHLARASGRPCYNLDGWMTDRNYVRQLFDRVTRDADLAVVDGVMGLFDGADPAANEGSTAEIACWLEAPVLLVVNAHGLARSIAALVKGYAEFDPRIRVAGVIANRSGSDRHRKWLAAALAAAGGPPLLGAIPRGAFPDLPSRHLGLVTADAQNLSESILEQLGSVLEKAVNLEGLIEKARQAPALAPPRRFPAPEMINPAVRIGLARDPAFHFYYPDNLDALAERGVVWVPFSPLVEPDLPSDLDALYLGGGYPEEFAAALSENRLLVEAIRRFAASGKPLYAECGGLMYLSQGIETRDGGKFPLVGLLPIWTRMLERLKTLGYVEVRLDRTGPWGLPGTTLRGHEFHYSEPVREPDAAEGWQRAYHLKRRRSNREEREGYQRDRILASYVHLHWASRPEAAAALIQYCGATS
ncbi:MAG: cobyrinate a,c-diamide synthase [Deltaproteobacteria bacterium]|nr:cobyrinate a,c-diamide synthase [Deltaproteobacteria bacterium]